MPVPALVTSIAPLTLASGRLAAAGELVDADPDADARHFVSGALLEQPAGSPETDESPSAPPPPADTDEAAAAPPPAAATKPTRTRSKTPKA